MKYIHLRVNFLLFGVLALLLLLGSTTQAATVTIQSDHLDIWHDKQQALFTGNVHLVRDDFELFCDSLRAFYKSEKDGGGIDHALAIGDVRLLQGDKKGSADSAVIDNEKQIITLKGNAVMQQVGGRIEGDIIVHDMVAKTTEVRQGENGRVRLRIDDKNAAPAKSSAAKTSPAKSSTEEIATQKQDKPEKAAPQADKRLANEVLAPAASEATQP